MIIKLVEYGKLLHIYQEDSDIISDVIINCNMFKLDDGVYVTTGNKCCEFISKKEVAVEVHVRKLR